MATHFSILAWKISWTEEPGGLQSMHAKLLQLCSTLWNLWTVAHQVPLSMGFSRQNYWGGLPFPPPGDLPNPGIKLMSLMSPALPGANTIN